MRPLVAMHKLRRHSLTLLAIAMGSGLLVSGLSQPVSGQSAVWIHADIRDVHGNLLMTTDESKLPELGMSRSELGEPFVYPLVYGAKKYLLGSEGGASAYLGISLGEALNLIAMEGDGSVTMPVVQSIPGYEYETRQLGRQRGPFNVTMAVPRHMVSHDGTVQTGAIVLVDGFLTAKVLDVDSETVIVRYQLEDGQVIPIQRTPFHARVILTNASEFYLMLQSPTNVHFTLSETCKFARYVLPRGSYFVEGLDDEALQLRRAPTVYPQLLGRTLLVTLTSVQGESEWNTQPEEVSR